MTISKQDIDDSVKQVHCMNSGHAAVQCIFDIPSLVANL